MRATDSKYDRYMPRMDERREVTMCSRSSRTDWIRHRRYENGRPDPIDMQIAYTFQQQNSADHQRSPLPCDLVCVCVRALESGCQTPRTSISRADGSRRSVQLVCLTTTLTAEDRGFMVSPNHPRYTVP
ncbi:Outer membrane protein [Anopheles sinensis]|uniref:Outer membrane protein n=1 Tax=Anopheles sinensis TaxID=74873 RepID=A0A084WRF5_ANOSI|nr:Outer membrane protein [Anopheles sinensis]